MTLSHAKSFTSSNTKEVITDLLKDVKLITKQMKTESFAALELKLHQAFAQAERECMTKLLEHYDWDYPSFKSQNKNYRKASRNTKRYMTLAGEVDIKRSLYRTERFIWLAC